jgi:hypothetical protein
MFGLGHKWRWIGAVALVVAGCGGSDCENPNPNHDLTDPSSEACWDKGLWNKPFGEDCVTGDDECASGHCSATNVDAVGFCTQLCDVNTPCPMDYECMPKPLMGVANPPVICLAPVVETSSEPEFNFDLLGTYSGSQHGFPSVHTISPSEWHMDIGAEYTYFFKRIDALYAIAWNSDENGAEEAGLWSRFDWKYEEGFLWYCHTTSAAESESAATDFPAADSDDLTLNGCPGGNGWYQLEQTEIYEWGSTDDASGTDEVISNLDGYALKITHTTSSNENLTRVGAVVDYSFQGGNIFGAGSQFETLTEDWGWNSATETLSLDFGSSGVMKYVLFNFVANQDILTGACEWEVIDSPQGSWGGSCEYEATN